MSGPYPLATLACTVDEFGITSPSYADIYASLQASMQSIYGSDVVIPADSQDGQMLAIFAQAQYDSNQVAIFVYNQFSPATSQGVGLSSVVKINGIARDIPTNSTADLTIVGQAGTTITNGIVGDNQSLNTQWALPATVTIPGGGSIVETATCTTPGAVTADAATLVNILTPTLGWQSSNNVAAATAGAPVETDSALRQRQAVSTALPALTVMESIIGNVADVTGVQRYFGYNNPTVSADANGIPAHNISIVVEGGDAVAVATAIAETVTPGTGTYGTTTETITDSVGIPNAINFYRLAEVAVTVTLTIKQFPGYASTTTAAIMASIVAYLNALPIGRISYLAALQAAATLPAPLGSTYTIASLSQSRASPIVNTVTTGGPYNAGATVIDVASATDIYKGQVIGFVLDNAAAFQPTVTSVTSNAITFTPGVPTARSVPVPSNVYLVSDVDIAFNEAAQGITGDVTVNVT